MAQLTGALEFGTVPGWLQQIDALSASARLDLAKVTRIDSAGAAFLLELKRRARTRGLDLRLEQAPQQVQSLLRFFEIDSVLLPA